MTGRELGGPARAHSSVDALARQAASSDAKRDDGLGVITEKLLGVLPAQSNPTYTKCPLMAGVLREAMRQAYDCGYRAAPLDDAAIAAVVLSVEGSSDGR